MLMQNEINEISQMGYNKALKERSLAINKIVKQKENNNLSAEEAYKRLKNIK